MEWYWFMNSNLKHILEWIVPYRILSRRRKRSEEAGQVGRQYGLYRHFVPVGSLAFDVGANIGNRIDALLRCGARIIAVEPQESCVAMLKRAYGSDPAVSIVNAAAGPEKGRTVLHISEERDTVASVSDLFVSQMGCSGRFGADRKWNKNIEVDVISLDMLIEQFGRPAFIKIDVEGFEVEVLSGLSTPAGVVSFEWTPDLPDNATRCVKRCCQLGLNYFQVSFGESMRFAFPNSISNEEIGLLIEILAHKQLLVGHGCLIRTH